MEEKTVPPAEERIPDWVGDAVVYQIFPERFGRGDTTNDPTRATLERPVDPVPDSWRITSWTSAWHAHVRSLNPAAYTVAEVWNGAPDYLARTGFSATMNYHAFAYPVKGFLVDAHLSPTEFAEMLNTRRSAFPEPLQPGQLNLVDSHDTQRIASAIVNRGPGDYVAPHRFDFDESEAVSAAENPEYDLRAPDASERDIQTLVALFQMTYVGAPMIYYGTEAGMWGGDDPDNRKPMVWPDLDYDDERAHPHGHDRSPDPVAFDDDLFDTYQALIALRNAHPALRRGAVRIIQTDDERSMLTFSRTHDDDTAVVVLNRSSEAHSVRIPLPNTLRGAYNVAYTTHDSYRMQHDAEALLVEIDAYAGLVLHRSDAE